MANALIHIIPTFIELVALAFCIGAMVFRLRVLTPAPGAAPPDYAGFLAGMRRLFGIAVTAMTAGSLADLLLRAAEMSGHPVPAVFPALPTVLLRTHYGRIWLIRLAALVLLWIGWWLSKRSRGSGALSSFMLGIGVIFAFSKSASGHASDAGDFSIPEIMDLLHLLAASVWGGGLFVLACIVLPKLVGPAGPQRILIADVARRFSRIAGMAVAVVTATAFYNAWFHAGSVSALWKTPYGLTSLAKILLLLILLSLGAFNRYVSVPLLQQTAGLPMNARGFISSLALHFLPRFKQDQDRNRVAFRFRDSVKAEALLIMGVLLAAALLQHEVPSRHIAHLEHAGPHGNESPHNQADRRHHMDMGR